MNKNHWVLVAFVATMVCNGSCRPREVDIKNIYPVYRSEKQLQLETPNRYDKQYEEKRDDDSVSYHRIDIPYKSTNRTDELAVKNNSKSIIDYVPVAITIKKPNIKIWPSDQNGIESADDLSLYNIYTNNINPLNPHHVTTPGYNYDFSYPSHAKPSILILEELTAERPSYDYDSVHTQPIQVLDRPPQNFHFYPPVTHRPVDGPTEYPRPPETEPPLESANNVYVTQEVTVEYPTETPLPETPTEQTTTLQQETTTKKIKNGTCPNVSVIANTVINNSNSIKKEGCQDVNILINTQVTNSNSGVGPLRPVNGVVVPIRPTNGVSGTVGPNQPTYVTSGDSGSIAQTPSQSSTGFFGVFDLIWSVITRIFSFPLVNPISLGGASPLSTLFTGLSAFFLPWIFPHLLLQGVRRQKRFVAVERDKYFGRPFDDHLSKPPARGWSPRKKISSSPLPRTDAENANKTSGKLDIESIATVARASNEGPPLPPPTALGHVLDTVSQLVESDIRTPPKLKEIIKEKANEHRKEVLGENSTPLPYTFIYDEEIGRFDEKTDATLLLDSSEGKASSEGVKGIAIPVVMDDDYELTAPPKKLQKIPEVPKPGKEDKKKTVTKLQPTTTPSSGLSTWILLSDNKDVTTPSPKKNNKKEEEKKKIAGTTTTKKPTKTQSTTQKSVTQPNKKATTKPAKKPETDTTAMSALEALVKNQKKGSSTTSKPKTTETRKKVPEKPEAAETKDRVEVELLESAATHMLPPSLHLPTVDDKSVTVTSQTSQSATESSVEGTTKKKTTTKKKKKNKNRKKKPTDDTGIEAKIPSQPVGSQIYNFLSREIVPTVGLGLIGVALTAGLASFLGYNPFGSSTIPLRRTYDTHHGYTPNYYNYNTDYGDGGQSEEVLFREVLSGMPEDSRYGLTHADSTYPDAYNRQDQMTYDATKNPAYPTASGPMYGSEKDAGSYDAAYPQDYSTGYGTYDAQDKKYPEVKEKYPVYTRETGTSFVYPETTGMTSAEKATRVNEETDKYSKTNSDTIERQPEALYRVASESDLQYRNKEGTIQGVTSQNSWHRIGSPMEAKKSYPVLEPGPRSLDLDKEPKKRSKRAAESVIQRISRKRTKKENDEENEIDFEDSFSDGKFSQQNLPADFSTTPAAATTTTTTTDAPITTTTTTTTTEESKEASTPEASDGYDSTAAPPSSVSVLDVLKRLAQFKLRLGLNFLRSTTDIFSRYLDDIQRRVDESFANATTTTVQYNKRKSPWSRIFFSRLSDDEDESYRRKRSVLSDKRSGGTSAPEDVATGSFSKSAKKDLRPSNKISHQKKNSPKKFESKRAN